MTNDLAATRSDLIATRKKHGATSAAGRICSNMLEITEKIPTATGDQLANLETALKVQAGGLVLALSKGERG